MSNLFSTKYPNNIRTVSGTITPKTDDVTLNCDTSSVPVVINLLSIPADYWNTTYKLYVFDGSNNAATNSITINAPAGQFINGQATLVINTSGQGVCIRIGNNLNYIATGTNSGTTFTDTGWLDMQGFSWITAPNSIPQYRVINKQIIFRRNLIIPLDNAGVVVPFASAASPYNNTYVQTLSKTPYQGAGGGVVLNSAGQVTFNNGNSIFQNAAHAPDTTYVGPWVIATRRIVSDVPQVNIALYHSVFVPVITSGGVLTLICLKDFEEGISGQQIGQSNLRYITSKANAGDIILDYRTITSGGNPATLLGDPAAPFTPVVALNTDGAKHTVSLDAANEDEVGGFAMPLMGFNAWQN